jgi:hypothetical protein
MKLTPKATLAHLVAGAVLIFLSLACMATGLFVQSKILTFLIFFFGVWSGVETGRYLEFFLQRKSHE